MGSSSSCFKGGPKGTEKKTTTTTKPLKSSLKNEAFVWQIDGFSSLLKQGNCRTQMGFVQQDIQWVLGVNPMDTKPGDKISAKSSQKYLSLNLSVSSAFLRSNCMIDTDFKFFIYDQKYGKHIECEACYTFLMNNYCSGALCMVSLETLNDASYGFLLNDTIAVGVELIQVKRQPCSLASTNFIEKNKLSGSYSWYIEDFSKLNRLEAISRPFEIAGYTWTLLLYPEGYSDKNYVALYLDLDDSNSLLTSSTGTMIDGTITIINQSGGNYSLNFRTNFNRDTRSWGYPKFIKQEQFKDPSNGYLIKGTCTIEISVCISGSSSSYKSEVVA